MLCLDLFCTAVSKICIKVLEKLKRAYEGITLSLKLNVIKDIRYDLVGFILGLGTWKFFSYKLMVIASSLDTISACKKIS